MGGGTVVLRTQHGFIHRALHEKINSQNASVIRSLCHRVCKLHLFHMDVNMAEFFVLQLVLIMQTNPFTVHMKLTIFLGMSPSGHQLYVLLIPVTICVLFLCTSYPSYHLCSVCYLVI